MRNVNSEMRPRVGSQLKVRHARKLGALAIWLGLLFLGPTAQGAAHDWLRFLEQSTWVVETKPDAYPLYLDGLSEEWYYVRDPLTHRAFALVLGSHTQILGLLAAHELAAGVGVDHLPLWPTLVQRGHNGIPLVRKPREPKSALPLHGVTPVPPPAAGDGLWVTALLTPVMKPRPLPPPQTTVESLLAKLKLHLFAVMLGAHSTYSVDTPQGPIFAFVLQLLTQIRELKSGDLRHFFFDFPHEALKALSPAEADWLINEVAAFLDLMESVGQGPLRNILAPYIHSAQAAVAGDRPNFDFNSVLALQRQIASLRGALQPYMRRNFGIHFARATLTRRPLPIDAQITPRKIADRWHYGSGEFPDPQTLKFTARHWLETFALAPPLVQMDLRTKWKEPLQTVDPIASLMGIARQWDGSVRLSHFKEPENRRNQHLVNENSQAFLNYDLPPTLVVYAANDTEGETVEALVASLPRELRVKSFKLELRRGAKLSTSDIEALAGVARSQNLSQLLLLECGGLHAEHLQALRAHGISAYNINHHEQAHWSQWHRYSAVEQLADWLGYRLSLEQYMVGLQDRAGIFGFLQLGWSREKVEEFLLHRAGLRGKRAQASLAKLLGNSVNDVIVDVRQYDDSIGAANRLFGLHYYPTVPTIVLERSSSVAISAKPSLIDSWYEQVRQMEGVNVVRAGDYGANLYLILAPRQQMTPQEIADRTVDFFKNSPLLTNPCVVELLGEALKH